MDVAGDSDDETKKSLTEAEIIKRKKERKRLRKDKLLKHLDKKRAAEQERDRANNVFQEQRDKLKQKSDVVGRRYTVSVALPGSILDNAQSVELRTYLAGQVARALAVFSVDEVVVFDDECSGAAREDASGQFEGVRRRSGCLQLARILQFLECPQYLRKNFFPIHKDLKYAGVLNPTDMPHHLRANEERDCQYREGVVVDRPAEGKTGNSWVYVGLTKEVVVDRRLEAGLRVTVKLDETSLDSKRPYGLIVSPSAPRTDDGLYWGYTVRLAESLTAVFSKCPFKGGYDHTVGTSERGSSVDSAELDKGFKHLLIVFGGVKGLEAALEADERLEGDDPAPLFDLYLNTCPVQGSRTIRTEEALLVTLSALRPKILASQERS